MDPKEVYVRSLLAQYQVFRQELLTFTNHFMVAVLMVPVAWVLNHVYHDYRLGCMLGVIAVILGLAMATHCGNHIQSLKRIAGQLNETMQPELRSFEYDLGQETDRVRYVVTLIGKIIACMILLWCFTPWPQL